MIMMPHVIIKYTCKEGRDFMKLSKKAITLFLALIIAVSVPLNTILAYQTPDSSLTVSENDLIVYPFRELKDDSLEEILSAEDTDKTDQGMLLLPLEGKGTNVNYLTRGFHSTDGVTLVEKVITDFYFVTQNPAYEFQSTIDIHHELTGQTYTCNIIFIDNSMNKLDTTIASLNSSNAYVANSLVFLDAGEDADNPYIYPINSYSTNHGFNRAGLKIIGYGEDASGNEIKPVIECTKTISIDRSCIVFENLTLDAKNTTFKSGDAKLGGFFPYKTYGAFVSLWDNTFTTGENLPTPTTGGGGVIDTAQHLVFNKINIRNVGSTADLESGSGIPILSNTPLHLDGLNRNDNDNKRINDTLPKNNRYVMNVTIEDTCYPTTNGSGVAIVRSNRVFMDSLKININSGGNAINLATSDVQAYFPAQYDKTKDIRFYNLDISGCGYNQQCIGVQEYKSSTNKYSPSHENIAVPELNLQYVAIKTASGTTYAAPGLRFYTAKAVENYATAWKPESGYAYRDLLTNDFIVRDGYSVTMDTQLTNLNTAIKALNNGGLYTDVPYSDTANLVIRMVSANQYADLVKDNQIGNFSVPAFNQSPNIHLVAVTNFDDDYTAAITDRIMVPYRTDAVITLNCNNDNADKARFYNFDFALNTAYTLHEAVYGVGQTNKPATEAESSQDGYLQRSARVTNTVVPGESAFVNCKFVSLVEKISINEKDSGTGGIKDINNIEIRQGDIIDLNGVNIDSGYTLPSVSGSIVTPDDNVPVTVWSSSDTTIATVDTDGKVTITGKPGKVTITAAATDTYNNGEIVRPADAVNIEVPVKYTVKHHTQTLTNTFDFHSETSDYNFLDTTIVSEDEQITIPGYTYSYAEVASIDLGEDAEDNVINLYYIRADQEYTVNYVEKGNPSNILKTPVTKGALFNATINAADEEIPIDGYNFDSASVGSIIIQADNNLNVITLFYTRTEQKYTVNYVEKDNPSNILATPVTKGALFDTIINAADEVVLIDGYGFDSASVDSITIKTDNNLNVITLYYVKTVVPPIVSNYTVNYLEKGTNEVLQTSKTAEATIGETIKGSDEMITISGYTYDSNSGDIMIEVDSTLNVINVYYTKNATTPETPIKPEKPDDNNNPSTSDLSILSFYCLSAVSLTAPWLFRGLKKKENEK